MTRCFAFLAAVALIAALALVSTRGAVRAQDTACTIRADVATGSSDQTVESGGETRSYRLYIPSGYAPSQRTPLVLSLHGFGESPVLQERDSGWDAIADRENFIVAYPAGTGSPLRWNAGQREIPGAQAEARGPLAQFLSGFFETVKADDVQFIRDLVSELEASNCIDPARIYVNGMSNGGGMTNRLACQAADLFAAAGMVAGAYTDFPGGCNPARPMPVMAFHGVTDPIVPYEGNPQIHFPAIETWVADWAKRDQCDLAAATVLQVAETVISTRYTGCAGNAEVVFFSIADGGHTWPGGSMSLEFLLGKTSQAIDASETMWMFFKAHTLSQ